VRAPSRTRPSVPPAPSTAPAPPAPAGAPDGGPAAQGDPRPARRHLLSVAELGREGIAELLRLAAAFAEVTERPIPRVPALRGRTVATLFFEPSTRTRLSFETAARRLSADVLSFSAQGSSMAKGESLRDTVATVAAMGADLLVVRHRSSGVPAQVARLVDVTVVNAGDGWHEHPTQALLDCYTIAEAFPGRTGGPAPAGGERRAPDFSGLRVGIVGDVQHSRVARSCVGAFTALGAEVVLVGPSTLLPPSLAGWPVAVATDLDAVLAELDVVYLLRLQLERMAHGLLPSLAEYTARYGLTAARAARLAKHAVVLHPGPMQRGVEIAHAVAELPAALVRRQVRNGVAVRMAVLFWALGTPARSDA
jgi:aspartate carbamoyltransferase catalytic subunit